MTVPSSAWVLGWASLAAQLVTLADRGPASGESALLSVPLSALVVWWVSSGVLRARMVRTWMAGIVLLLVAVLGPISLLVEPSPLSILGAITGVVAFAAFVSYVRSDLFAQLRAEPARTPAAFGGLLALAVTVGALGGLTAPPTPDQQPDRQVRIGLSSHSTVGGDANACGQDGCAI